MKFRLFPYEIERIQLNIPKEFIIREFNFYVDFNGSHINLPFSGIKDPIKDIFLLRLRTSNRSPKACINISLNESGIVTEVILEYALEIFAKISTWFFIYLVCIIQGFIIYLTYDSFFTDFQIENILPILAFVGLNVLMRLGFYQSKAQSQELLHKIILRTRQKYRK